jgi:FkbM family methyltransferase
MKLETIGETSYGQWCTDTSGLDKDSIVYSFGVGDDASWDLELIRRFGCKVYAFDPDPKSVAWVRDQHMPDEFVFIPVGLSGRDGEEKFYDPYNDKNVNVSILKKDKTFSYLPVKRLATFMQELGHDHIDLLKINIEGAEYKVIKDICRVDARQLLMDVHNRFINSGWKGLKPIYWDFKTRLLFWRLRRRGFKVVHVSGGNAYTFIR